MEWDTPRVRVSPVGAHLRFDFFDPPAPLAQMAALNIRSATTHADYAPAPLLICSLNEFISLNARVRLLARVERNFACFLIHPRGTKPRLLFVFSHRLYLPWYSNLSVSVSVHGKREKGTLCETNHSNCLVNL